MKSPFNNVSFDNNALKIESFNNPFVACKLIAMGITPGCKVECIRKAPFNGAYYLKIDGNSYALREQEFCCIDFCKQ